MQRDLDMALVGEQKVICGGLRTSPIVIPQLFWGSQDVDGSGDLMETWTKLVPGDWSCFT